MLPILVTPFANQDCLYQIKCNILRNMCSGLCFHLTLKKTSTNLSENVYNLGGTNLVTAARQTKTTQLESFPAYFTPTEDMGPPKCWAEGLSGSWQAWGGTISAVGWIDIQHLVSIFKIIFMSPIPKNWHSKVCIFSKNHKDLKNIKSLNICKYLPITTKNNCHQEIRNLKKVIFLFFQTPNMGQRKIFFFFQKSPSGAGLNMFFKNCLAHFRKQSTFSRPCAKFKSNIKM